MKKKIVIVGGGFGGVSFINNFDTDSAEVVLLSANRFFVFTPILPEAATSRLSVHDAHMDLERFCKSHGVGFFESTVERIDLENKKIFAGDLELPYDSLIICTGSEDNYYGIKGASDYSLSIRTHCGAGVIKNKLNTYRALSEPKKIVVVGAGPTGIEIALGMREFLETKPKISISIINNVENLLPQFPEYIGKKASESLVKNNIELLVGAVSEVFENRFLMKDGREFAFDLMIWAAGVKARFPKFSSEIELKQGRVVVDGFLRVVNQKNVFVLGDSAITQEPLPMLGQVASRQGEYLGANLHKIISGRDTKPFVYESKGSFVLLGHSGAVGVVAGMKIFGLPALWLWRAAYLYIFKSNYNRFQILKHWLVG